MIDDAATSPPAPPSAPALPRHPNSTTAFVLSILGLAVMPLLSIISFFIARSARRDIAAHPGQYDADDGQLRAAWIMSIIGLAFVALAVALVILFAVLLAVSGDTATTIQSVGDVISESAP